jgi:hypothetical protein
MCVVSMIGDHYARRWPPYWQPPTVYPTTGTAINVTPGISRDEFEALRAEVAEMKELLRAAKRIDELTGQPDCEIDEKLAVLRKVAEFVGIDLDDVLRDPAT